jgi:DNA-binding transcriptional LysR family regulator
MIDSPQSAEKSLNWSTMKDFLAVAESGTLSGAARKLGVSQPTLTRRMASLEESLRVDLFRRSPRGLELTEAGEALLAPAREMELAAHAVELAATGHEGGLSGLVRLTATEGVAQDWLMPQLARFRREHPGIDFEIIVANSAVNVLRREADIAIRLGRPAQKELVAQRVAELSLGLYAAHSYVELHGAPQSRAELAEHEAIAFAESDRYTGAGSWLEQIVAPARIVCRANTLGGQRAAIRAGLGIGGQACFIAGRDPELVRLLPSIEMRLETWLVTHPGLRRSRRIRAVLDFLAERLREDKPLLDVAPSG